MNINNALKKIKHYDEITTDIINLIDDENFEKEIISKTADFIKENFNVKNIYICEKNNSSIILKNSKCNPFFKIKIDSIQKENLPFTINAISHPLVVDHQCPLLSDDGIPAICIPIKKLLQNEEYNSYLQIQFSNQIQLQEEDSILLTHIALSLQKAYQYHNKVLLLGKNLDTLNKEYKQFIHFVSHDLKSPVTAILGFIAIINDENIIEYSGNLRHYIERISINAKIIDRMINDILYVSRLRRIDTEEINVNELIAESIIPLNSSIKSKNLTLLIEENLPMIIANRSHISKLFQLILKNSINFTDKGGQIKIGYRNNEFYISDTGIGIKDSNIEKVFRIFYTTCDKKENHIGTGLYIAKKIVELYNGNIRVDSKFGKGTTVYFTLPLININ